MDQERLVTEQIDAGAKFLGELERKIPVAAAFWLKAPEESRYLYVVWDPLDDKDLDVAYGEVLQIANQMRNPYFDPFRVKLIKPSHALAKAALENLRRFPGRMATRLHRTNFGGVGVDEANIYPMPITVP
jgi:hypothetical protein